MRQTSHRVSRGFSLLELITVLGLGILVLSGALVLTRQAVRISDMVAQRSEMQQNGRVAINMMARDLSLSGIGFPTDGVQLPSGTSSQDSYFACDPSDCYITDNIYTQERLFAVTPGDGKGPTIQGVATDVVTLVYSDSTSHLDQYVLTGMDVEGSQVFLDLNTTPAYDDPVVGLRAGDVLVLSNVNGIAVGTVTEVLTNGEVRLAANDALGLNQGDAGFGNILSITSPPDPPDFPPTFAKRIHIVSYYIDASDPNSIRLMRQVSAHPPVPVAENVVDLQMTYDIFDDITEAGAADLPDAGSSLNQIRKINISLAIRSSAESLSDRDSQRIHLTTSVGPRNLTYRDRYP